MLDHLVKRAREQRVFSREDTPTERRVEAAFLYHLGLSYRQVGEWFGHSHQAVHEWYTALADLFEPEPDEHGTVVVDETKVVVDDREVYVWAAIGRHTYEVITSKPRRVDLNLTRHCPCGPSSNAVADGP